MSRHTIPFEGIEIEYELTRKNVKYINTGSNLGGAGGFSFGIKQAVQQKYEYLWIMDDDTMPLLLPPRPQHR